MAQQAAAFAACFVDKPGEIDPYRGQCGKSCDPIEPTVHEPASASCFASLDADAPNRIQSRECWAARCGTADQTADGCCGPEQRTITGTAQFPDLCAQATLRRRPGPHDGERSLRVQRDLPIHRAARAFRSVPSRGRSGYCSGPSSGFGGTRKNTSRSSSCVTPSP